MKERPIIFSASMVRAILAGTMTQTRRVVKPEPAGSVTTIYRPFANEPNNLHFYADNVGFIRWYGGCPYGQPGDRLWVREAWKAHTTFDHLPPREIPQSHVWYMADDGYKAESRYRQGMFMPRWASRITLEVTGGRVERLQDISEADAQAEGVTPKWEPGCSGRLMEALGGFSFRPAASAYAELWEQINGPGSWDANPWVWVVEFKRVTP
jgi:hypothetical protein